MKFTKLQEIALRISSLSSKDEFVLMILITMIKTISNMQHQGALLIRLFKLKFQLLNRNFQLVPSKVRKLRTIIFYRIIQDKLKFKILI